MEFTKHGKVGVAAMRADMDRKTARKYLAAGKLPSEMKKPRAWRTRSNPFEQDWEWVTAQLAETPALEAKTLFEALQAQHPGRYQDGQLRTLQRHIKQWRAEHGPEREVFFPQEHRPGEAVQLDFTEMASLQITLAGAAFVHLLCHVVLPYSNWEHVTVCLSESFLALRKGLQAALFALRRVPGFVQTDNSTAATHQVSKDGPKRAFNDDYLALTKHLGVEPRTIAVGKKEQNGDVESSHRALKRRIEQALLLRGSRDFESEQAYIEWLDGVVARANRGRQERFEEDLSAMSPLRAKRQPEFVEHRPSVTSWSTIRVSRCTYSVPSRFIGETLTVRLFETRLEVYYGSKLQFDVERIIGRGHRIDYRHVIWSLVQKPGAFARYRYREDLFPSLIFRRAYDAITAEHGADTKGDLVYLRVLLLAAAEMESSVETALGELLDAGDGIDLDVLKRMVGAAETVEVPDIAPYEPAIGAYDDLLGDDDLEAAE